MNHPIILKLPAPPPLNSLYPTVGRKRVKSKRYKAWLTEAGWQLQLQRPGSIAGPWEIDVGLPRGLTGDIDGYLKGMLDLIVSHKIVDDDKHCRRLSIAKAVTIGADAIITLTPFSTEEAA